MQAKNPKIHVERSFYRSLLALTLPVALQNVISYSVNLMDTLMLGGLGEVALSATSLANQVFFIYTVAIFGVAGGAIVLCSQYWGKRTWIPSGASPAWRCAFRLRRGCCSHWCCFCSRAR